MAEQQVAEVLTFPTDPTVFENDDRISFSKLDSKYIAVQSDGTEFEFDHGLKRWIPLADEDDEALFQQQQSAYSIDQQSSAAGGDQYGNNRKRKQDDVEVSCARWPIQSCPDDP
jgi:HIV Tat-specific factor 1